MSEPVEPTAPSLVTFFSPGDHPITQGNVMDFRPRAEEVVTPDPKDLSVPASAHSFVKPEEVSQLPPLTPLPVPASPATPANAAKDNGKPKVPARSTPTS